MVCLFAFNFFSRLQARTMDEMERLGTRLVDHIRRDAEAETEAGASAGRRAAE